MVSQFFKILAAVVAVKVTGYALVVTLLQQKLPVGPAERVVLAGALAGNFVLVWRAFRGTRNACYLVAAFLNLALVGAVVAHRLKLP
jgi:hypothetical protein